MTALAFYSSLLVIIICIKVHVLAFTFVNKREILSLKQSVLKLRCSTDDHFARVNSEGSDDAISSINLEEVGNYDLDLLIEDKSDVAVQVREEDLQQYRDLDLILTERAKRFYDPKLVGIEREKCILIAVGTYSLDYTLHSVIFTHSLMPDKTSRRYETNNFDNSYEKFVPKKDHLIFSLKESLSELCELVGTANLQVVGSCIQRLNVPNTKTYIGPGKVVDIMTILNSTNTRTIVVDDDLSTKQQRNLETLLQTNGGGDVKLLDRTAIILEIFAQHARSREGQLQVELAMLEYRLTRGPRASGTSDRDKGCGFRGPGETKIETDKRIIKDKIVLVKKEIDSLGVQREQHRKSRSRLGLPVVALVGYTNAGKSTLLNKLSKAGVLAENMLFATLDPTTRRIQLPKNKKNKIEYTDAGKLGGGNKGKEVFLTDTVGFISKLPTDLVTAFRATLEEVGKADVLIHVIDRSSPVWEKQRETVLKELDAIGCENTPIVELWNKIDVLDDEQAENIRMEAACMPIDVDAVMKNDSKKLLDDNDSRYQWSEDDEHVKDTALTVNVVDRNNRNYERRPTRTQRRTMYIAASAKSGLGFDDFIEGLEDTLNLLLKKVDVFIPFNKDDGIIAMIHNQGIVDSTDYNNSGTILNCRVPDSLYERLIPYRITPKLI